MLHLAEVSVAQPAPQPPAPAPVARPNVDAKPIASRTGDLSVLSVDYYKLQVTISQSTHEKLRRAQDLLRHTNPTGDLATLLDRAVTLLLADFERRRCAATPAPRAPATEGGTGRHIPATVKREVWQRDQGRCAFIGTSGRCRETAFVEFHHVEPFAEGGLATVENIQLRCKAHNLYEASLFGDGADCVREHAVTFGGDRKELVPERARGSHRPSAGYFTPSATMMSLSQRSVALTITDRPSREATSQPNPATRDTRNGSAPRCFTLRSLNP